MGHNRFSRGWVQMVRLMVRCNPWVLLMSLLLVLRRGRGQFRWRRLGVRRTGGVTLVRGVGWWTRRVTVHSRWFPFLTHRVWVVVIPGPWVLFRTRVRWVLADKGNRRLLTGRLLLLFPFFSLLWRGSCRWWILFGTGS